MIKVWHWKGLSKMIDVASIMLFCLLFVCVFEKYNKQLLCFRFWVLQLTRVSCSSLCLCACHAVKSWAKSAPSSSPFCEYMLVHNNTYKALRQGGKQTCAFVGKNQNMYDLGGFLWLVFKV
jgi:hypothetical protein